jgi:hypothetical protein
MKITIIVLILFCVCSCRVENETKKSGDLIGLHQLLIKFEKQENQYGYPAYAVEIYSDGSVIVQNRGGSLETKKAAVEKSRLDGLSAEFDRAGFLNLSGRYVEGDNCKTIITHEQTVTIFYYGGGANKTIYHYLGCQGTDETEGLRQLEKGLEDFIRTEKLLD